MVKQQDILVSIAIPAYKPGKLFRPALESCLRQTHQNLEIIVAVDGESPEVHEIAEELDDDRVTVLESNGVQHGQHGNFNRAVDATTGEFIKLFCADDLMAVDCIERMLAVLTEGARTSFCASTHLSFEYSSRDERPTGRVQIQVDPQGRYCIELSPDEAGWLNARAGNFVGGPTNVMIRRQAWWQMGGLDPRMNYAGDRELWYRLMNRDGIALLTRPLVAHRRHDNSVGGRTGATSAPVDDGVRLLETVEPNPLPFSRTWLQGEVRRLQSVDSLSGFALGLCKRAPEKGAKAMWRLLTAGGVVRSPINMATLSWSVIRRQLVDGQTQWPFDTFYESESWRLQANDENLIRRVLNGKVRIDEVAMPVD